MAGLFFVNKTGSSQDLSRSSRSESAAMMSHVQRKRRKAEGRPQNKPWSGFVSIIPPQSEQPSYEETRTAKKTAALSIARTARAAPSSSSSLDDLPSTYPTSNGYDPFHCTIIGIEAGTHELLRHTFFGLARANFLAEAFCPNPSQLLARGPSHQASSRHRVIVTQRLRHCIDNKLLMHATLAYSSSMLAWATGQFGHQQPPEFYIAKAIPDLRSRLGQKTHRVDNWMLLSLYSLAITELWNGLPLVWAAHVERRDMVEHMAADSLTASRVHLMALMHLVGEAGGWHLFDPYIFDSTLLADKYLAIASCQPPMLLPLSWDPGPLPEHMRAGHDRALKLGYPLLGRRLLEEPLAMGLIKILEDLVEYCQTAHDTWSQSDSAALEVEAWLFRRSQAIQYRLLLQSHDHNAFHRDRCTSIAALIFICLAIPAGGSQMAARYLARSLRTAIADEPSPAGHEDSMHLRAWILFMGSLVPAPFEDDRAWFMRQLRLQSSGCIRLLSVMEEYLFLPTRQGHLTNRSEDS